MTDERAPDELPIQEDERDVVLTVQVVNNHTNAMVHTEVTIPYDMAHSRHGVETLVGDASRAIKLCLTRSKEETAKLLEW